MPILLLHTVAIVLSAFLLFLVQPMFAKMALPLLGGSPHVWATCMVFFQAALLAGYGYSHWTSTRLSFPRQAIVHGAIMLLPFLTLPIAIAPDVMPPATARPELWLLGLLAVSVGLPFFVVSTTGPLLQKWFSHTGHPHAGDPYFLYAASNVGSMVGLLGYPLLVEPSLRLTDQSLVWMIGYVILVTITLATALSVYRVKAGHAVSPTESGIEPVGTDPLPPGRMLRWVALAFVPSSLMLGLTTHLTTDIAAIPLLWVIPLALYLLTFTLVFARRVLIPHQAMARTLPVVALLLVMLLVSGTTSPTALILLINVACFFVAAMVCHGELAADRPNVRHLTMFYLMLSVGGALGGVFNALLSPLLFDTVIEYPIAIVLACVLCPPRESLDTRFDWKDMLMAAAPPAAVLALPLLVEPLTIALGVGGKEFDTLRTALVIALPLLGCYLLSHKPIRFALALGGWYLASHALYEQTKGQSLYGERSFYGVHRVNDSEAYQARVLRHGFTAHGMQKWDPRLKNVATAYYHPSGPAGQVFQEFGEDLERVGLVGLGAGTLAVFARPNSHFVFYEIDPVVEAIAENPNLFSFLDDARSIGATIQTRIGDARLTLNAEPDHGLDLLVIDAFSSAAIPVHLLTREALTLYLAKIKPDGMLLFHISNKSLNIRRPLSDLAADLDVTALVQNNQIESPQEYFEGKFASQWVLMSHDTERLERLPTAPNRWVPLNPRGDSVWTDDFSNIVQLIIED